MTTVRIGRPPARPVAPAGSLLDDVLTALARVEWLALAAWLAYAYATCPCGGPL